MPSDDDRIRSESQHPPVLCFHKATPRWTFGSTNYSPSRLIGLLESLTRSGFGTSKPSNSTSKGHGVILTFDDGYAHLADVLPPLIEKFRLPTLILVPTAYVGKSNKWDYSHAMSPESHLSVDQIKRLSHLGVRFGSHGHRHIELTSLDQAALSRELRTSKGMLEDILGKAVDSISYPFGRVNRRVIETAGEVGFSTGYTMSFPKQNDGSLARGRYAVYFYDSPATVLRKLEGGPLYGWERFKARLTNRLSYGTILLNRLRGTAPLDN